jgi:hypothetical protein
MNEKLQKLQELNEYRNSPCVSQSFLKSIPNGYISRKKQSLVMTLGSLLDCYITTPLLLEDLFLIYEGKRPSDKIVEIIDFVCEDYINNNNLEDHSNITLQLEELEDYVIKAVNKFDYQNNWKDKTTINTSNENIEIKIFTIIDSSCWRLIGGLSREWVHYYWNARGWVYITF